MKPLAAVIAALTIVASVACGDDASSDATTTDGDGPATDGGPLPDAPPVDPPAATCMAPVAAVDTTTPDHVVGDGTAASCTEAALRSALADGGVVTFACGAAPAVIAIGTTLELRTDVNTTLDGGGTVTLDGGATTRILSFQHPDYRVNGTVLTLQHLAFTRGRATGTRRYAAAPAPCSQGFYDGSGGALEMRDGELVVIDSQFITNRAESLGPDVGGGAIALLGVRRAVIVSSVFQGNRGSNAGAIGVLNSELSIYNSSFDGNVAEGHGANGDDASRCAVVAETGQHQTGSGGNGGAIAIDGGDDLTHTFCGVRFSANQGGEEALGGALFRTPDRAKQSTIIDRSTFASNHGYSAGAAYFHNSSLQIVASAFVANTASHGSGALQADGTTFDITNVTFAENSALLGLGGALSLFGGDGSITFTTFANNHADGGDPYFGAAIGGNPTLGLRGDLFVNNTARNPGAPMQCQVTGTGDGNLQFPRTHVVGTADDAACTPTTTFADPLLGMLGDHGGPTPSLVPGSGSPAIGAAGSCPATDQRGSPRPGARCTSGSIEP